MRNTLLHILFVLIALAVLLAELIENKMLTWAAKPLIMVWVIAYYLINTRKKEHSNTIVLAFLAAWLGDVLLMFQSRGAAFFMLGLGSFLVCQLLYAKNFAKKVLAVGLKSNWLFKEPIWLLLLFFYMVSLYIAMYPGLGSTLKLPVFVYALAISSMAAAALSRKRLVDKKSYKLILVGSLLFVLSDSLLGLNKFSLTIPQAGFWVLLTYMAAQYFIVRGLVLKT